MIVIVVLAFIFRKWLKDILLTCGGKVIPDVPIPDENTPCGLIAVPAYTTEAEVVMDEMEGKITAEEADRLLEEIRRKGFACGSHVQKD